MHVSSSRTLTKTDICSECTLSFHALNEHILLIKRDYEIGRALTKILLWACVKVLDAKILNFNPYIIILTGT